MATQQHTNATATTLKQLTDDIRTIDRTLAPGSETSLWGDYLEDMRVHTGALPLGEFDGSLAVPVDVEWYWRARYQAIADAADFIEEFPGESLTGDWDSDAFALLKVPKDQHGECWDIYSETLRDAIEGVR